MKADKDRHALRADAIWPDSDVFPCNFRAAVNPHGGYFLNPRFNPRAVMLAAFVRAISDRRAPSQSIYPRIKTRLPLSLDRPKRNYGFGSYAYARIKPSAAFFANKEKIRCFMR
jgi:hypothetical protein